MFIPVFTGVLGLGMILYWIVMLIGRQIPEIKTEPARIGTHILAELITGILLIVAALVMLFAGSFGRPLFLFATGMLAYTLIASPGYFVHKKQWMWVLAFRVIFVLTIYSIFLYLS